MKDGWVGSSGYLSRHVQNEQSLDQLLFSCRLILSSVPISKQGGDRKHVPVLTTLLSYQSSVLSQRRPMFVALAAIPNFAISHYTQGSCFQTKHHGDSLQPTRDTKAFRIAIAIWLIASGHSYRQHRCTFGYHKLHCPISNIRAGLIAARV
jgi:hypothetical protein